MSRMSFFIASYNAEDVQSQASWNLHHQPLSNGREELSMSHSSPKRHRLSNANFDHTNPKPHIAQRSWCRRLAIGWYREECLVIGK